MSAQADLIDALSLERVGSTGARLCPVTMSARFTKNSRGSLPGRYRAVTVDAACSMRAATAAGCDT
jgi:hypothetical protein